MRALIVIVILLLILAAVGWLKFSSPNGDPTLRVDTEKVRQDTSTIVEKSKQAVDHAAEKIDASIDSEPISPTNKSL
ncbi:MAG: hypothetical protein IT422_08105 [Pirellulaceae bacterium]|nr:hypothetical protein [Pirellulaceae bacterium]